MLSKRKTKIELANKMQDFIAETCIGASSLRGQGASGLIRESRKHFKSLDLSMIPVSESVFNEWLNRQTDRLLRKFPERAKNHGAARKALNLFLRSACYNVVLSKTHGLNRLLPLLEVPVDSFTADHLRWHDRTLPKKWAGLKWVEKKELSLYQSSASALAKRWSVNRVDLDIFFFREDLLD